MLTRLLVILALLAPVPAPALEAGEMVPEIALTDGQGRGLRLADSRGSVVYLDFWASWCAPCKQSFPWLDALRQRYAERGLRVIAVNLDQERPAADRFLSRLPVGFTIAYDPPGDSARAFGVTAMPHSFLIDRDGRVRQIHRGFRDGDRGEREAEVRRALGIGDQPG